MGTSIAGRINGLTIIVGVQPAPTKYNFISSHNISFCGGAYA